MNGDKMTPTERWKAIFNGDPVDRVPVFPMSQGHTALINGYPNLGAYYEHPEVAYKCGKIARELYGYEQPIAVFPPGYFSAEWGTKILYPYNPKMGSVAPIDPIVKTPEDVEKLEVPDPYTAYGWNELIATLKDVIAKKDFPYTFILAGCMTAVCPLITSVETFMRWTITEPDVAKKLLVKSRDYGIRSVERLVKELGADNFLLGDGYPTDSNVLISAKKFEEFTLPNLVEVHEKALKMGIPGFWAHWCSDHSKNIKAGLVDKVPLGKHGIMHFGPEVDTKTAVEHFGNRYIIMGNVDPVSMLLKTHEEVLQLAKQDIEKGKHSPKGYMLGVGCEMPPRTPPANVYALVKASREYGRY